MAKAQIKTSPVLKVKSPGTLARLIKANSGFIFIAPALLIFTIFGLYTIVYSGVLGFFRWNGYGTFSLIPFECSAPTCQFVGLDNFADFLFRNPTVSKFFWQALVNNLIIAFVVTAATIAIALPLAVALNTIRRGRLVLRTLILLPMVTTGIAIYNVWNFIYQPDGLLNNGLKTVGLGFLAAKDGWLGQADRALPALMVVMIWSAVPFASILYLAGLQTISPDLYEAAIIDGANRLSILRRIIWPLLKSTTVIIVITSINTALQGYELVYLMTKGGPAGHTQVLGLQIYQYGFGDNQQLGLASSISWVLFLFVLIVALLNLRFFRSQD